MSHIDADELSVIALGEPPSAADERHLQQCARCRSRLDQLTAVVAASRSVTVEDRPVAPPDAVWSAIASELGLAADESAATVVSLDAARRSRRGSRALIAAAAVVGLIAGSAVTATVLQRDGGASSPQIVASAPLAPMGDADVAGTAALERTANGAVLHVSVPNLPVLEDGYYEVWMATADASTMVAIGTLNPGEEGTFVLPAGMEATDFPLVDVSIEHFDGDPSHSVESVVRGQLPA